MTLWMSKWMSGSMCLLGLLRHVRAGEHGIERAMVYNGMEFHNGGVPIRLSFLLLHWQIVAVVTVVACCCVYGQANAVYPRQQGVRDPVRHHFVPVGPVSNSNDRVDDSQ